MATATDSNCPICQETWDDAASALPCGHQFCVGCILRWTTTNPSCPLCRTPIETVRFSERDEEDYVQFVITSHAEPAETSSQAERAPGHPDQNSSHGPAVSPPLSAEGTLSPAEPGPSRLQSVGGLLPEVWAGLLRQEQHLLEPVRPWLRRRLQGIFRDHWWLAEAAESSILNDLCLYGPDAAILVQRLQNHLKEHTAPLVRGLIHSIVSRCSKEAKMLLHGRHDREDNSGSSGSSSCTSSRHRTPDSGPAGSSVQDEATTSQSGLQSNPSCPQPARRAGAAPEEPEQTAGKGPCA